MNFKDLPIRTTIVAIMTVIMLLMLGNTLVLLFIDSFAKKTSLAIILCLASFIIIILTNWYLVRCLMNPLSELKRYLLSIGDGNLNNKIDHFGDNCVGQLYPLIAGLQQNNAAIVRSIRSSTIDLLEQATKLTQGNQALAKRTEQGATAVAQTAATMEQLSATINRNADNAIHVNELAHQTAESAHQSSDLADKVKQNMVGIEDNSKKINEITTIINSIAFQTNILALNAAVEAARAGEQGRGFAVVASEVRSLAQRCSESARDIAQQINSASSLIKEGVGLVEQSKQVTDDMVLSISHVSHVMHEISISSEEQSKGVHQATNAVNKVDRITQQNSEMAEQASNLVESLEILARKLNQEVDLFKLQEDNGTQASATYYPALHQNLQVAALS